MTDQPIRYTFDISDNGDITLNTEESKVPDPQTLDEYIEERAAIKAADQTSELRRELEVIRQDSRELRQKNRRYVDRNAQLMLELETEKSRNRELSEDVDDLRSRLDDETDKNAQLKTALNLNSGLLKETAVREDELRRTISHLREELDQAEDDRAKLEADLFLSHRQQDDLRNLLTLERLRQFQISQSITVEL